MNKSLAFIDSIIKEGRFGDSFPRRWEHADARAFFDVFVQFYPEMKGKIKDGKCSYTLGNNEGRQQRVLIVYDPDAQFQWVTSETNYNDGSLIFVSELYNDVLKKVLLATTYYQPTAPDGFSENRWVYDLEYTVGDLLWLNEHGDLGIEGKPWMESKDAVALPLSIKYIQHDASAVSR